MLWGDLMDFLVILEEELQEVKTYTDPKKYSLTKRAFSMNPNWKFIEYIMYILTNKGKSSTLEIENFVDKYFDGDESKLITKQNLSQQRKKISYTVFKDMNYKFIKKFYGSEEYNPYFNDHIVLLIDGSKSEIPNTPETKSDFNINEDNGTNKKASRTLFSTVIDAKYGIVLDAILGKANSSERELAKQHIKNIEGLINLNKVILIFDAGYYSLELKLYLEKKGLKYIFRLAPNVYKDEISQMQQMDEILKIENTPNRRQNIKDKNTLKKVKKLPYIETRVGKIPIINQEENNDEMILLTNLTENQANIFELGALYAKRWEIEVNYDRLKNKMELENYGGKLEITISQDFYSSIYVFNLAMILRNNIQKHLERRNKKKRETEEKEYRTNINTLIGRIKNRLLELFTSPIDKIKKILERIIKRGTKDTYLYDFNRPKKHWHEKTFIGKFRFNQRRNI